MSRELKEHEVALRLGKALLYEGLEGITDVLSDLSREYNLNLNLGYRPSQEKGLVRRIEAYVGGSD